MTTHRSCVSILALTVALALAPACDKGGDKSDDKAAAKTDDANKTETKDDKAEAKADEHAGHEMAAGDDKAAEIGEVAEGGTIEIEVDAGGYHPAEIHAPAKSKVTLSFKRTTEAGCGQKVVIKDMEVEKDLPVGEAVEIEVEVPESGELGFACGMNMYKGKVVPKS